MHKDVRKLIRDIEANGFTVTYGARSQGRGHAKVLSTTGGSYGRTSSVRRFEFPSPT